MMNRNDWLALRRTGVGGSDSAAILGVDPFKSAHDVYLDKIGEGEDSGETNFREWGLRLEPVLAQKAAEDLCVVLTQPDIIVCADRPWLLGTPDRFVVGRDELVELKTANVRQITFWGEAGSDEIPERYIVQCQKYLWLSKRLVAWVAALIAGNDFRLYRVDADRELQEAIIESDTRFWHDYVVPRVPPPLDGSKHATEWVAKRWPRASADLTKRATAEFEAMMGEFAAVRPAFLALKERVDEFENQTKAFMGPAERVEGRFGTVTWKNDKRGKPDWKAVAEQLATNHALTAEELAAVVALHTPVPGPRKLHTKFAKAELPPIKELIERSSFGTPEATAIRADAGKPPTRASVRRVFEQKELGSFNMSRREVESAIDRCFPPEEEPQ